MPGIEPVTFCLKSRSSTTEPWCLPEQTYEVSLKKKKKKSPSKPASSFSSKWPHRFHTGRKVPCSYEWDWKIRVDNSRQKEELRNAICQQSTCSKLIIFLSWQRAMALYHMCQNMCPCQSRNWTGVSAETDKSVYSSREQDTLLCQGSPKLFIRALSKKLISGD